MQMYSIQHAKHAHKNNQFITAVNAMSKNAQNRQRLELAKILLYIKSKSSDKRVIRKCDKLINELIVGQNLNSIIGKIIKYISDFDYGTDLQITNDKSGCIIIMSDYLNNSNRFRYIASNYKKGSKQKMSNRYYEIVGTGLAIVVADFYDNNMVYEAGKIIDLDSVNIAIKHHYSFHRNSNFFVTSSNKLTIEEVIYGKIPGYDTHHMWKRGVITRPFVRAITHTLHDVKLHGRYGKWMNNKSIVIEDDYDLDSFLDVYEIQKKLLEDCFFTYGL